MRVLGLDLSLTRTGVAYADGTCGLLVPPKDVRGCERMVWIRDEVLRACTGYEGTAMRPITVDVVAIEGFAFGAKGSAVFDIGGIGHIVRVALFEAGIRYVEVPPGVVKRYATGSGNANKLAMVVAAGNRLGYDKPKPDDNEADALWLRALALDAYGEPVVQMPRAQRDSAVKAITWPRVRAGAAA